MARSFPVSTQGLWCAPGKFVPPLDRVRTLVTRVTKVRQDSSRNKCSSWVPQQRLGFTWWWIWTLVNKSLCACFLWFVEVLGLLVLEFLLYFVHFTRSIFLWFFKCRWLVRKLIQISSNILQLIVLTKCIGVPRSKFVFEAVCGGISSNHRKFPVD